MGSLIGSSKNIVMESLMVHLTEYLEYGTTHR